MSQHTADDFLPAASLTHLRRRAELARIVRRHFESQGYWEVETPILSSEIIQDAWLEPFVAGWLADPSRWRSGGEPRYLQTSPEAHMKRLLAAGADAVFQFSRVFRNGEIGRRHNPEFTMVEWYRVGDDHHRQMDFVEGLLRTVFAATADWRTGPPFDWQSSFERLTYDAAFERWAGTRVLNAPTGSLGEIAVRQGIVPPPSLAPDDRDGWLNLLLATLIEPQLGSERPAFLHDYPASQAALAHIRRDSPDAPPVTERFELYVRGIEVCNGYHELTDADALAQRTADQASARAAAGLLPLPAPGRLLAAMRSGLPPCSGVALGFDRLAMLALGVDEIRQVLAFPFDRA
jgi:lysyl-tRNA synthetase class 2